MQKSSNSSIIPMEINTPRKYSLKTKFSSSGSGSGSSITPMEINTPHQYINLKTLEEMKQHYRTIRNNEKQLKVFINDIFKHSRNNKSNRYKVSKQMYEYLWSFNRSIVSNKHQLTNKVLGNIHNDYMKKLSKKAGGY